MLAQKSTTISGTGYLALAALLYKCGERRARPFDFRTGA